MNSKNGEKTVREQNTSRTNENELPSELKVDDEKADRINSRAKEGTYKIPPELTNFKKTRSPLKLVNAEAFGFNLELWQSDPSRVIYHDGKYHVWMIDHSGKRFKKSEKSQILYTALTGSEIEFYLTGLRRSDWGQTQWSGFKAELTGDPVRGERWKTDLEPDRSYRVVMPEREWEKRYLRLTAKVRENPERWGMEAPAREGATAPLDFTFTDAVSEYLESLMRDGEALSQHISELAAAAVSENP